MLSDAFHRRALDASKNGFTDIAAIAAMLALAYAEAAIEMADRAKVEAAGTEALQ